MTRPPLSTSVRAPVSSRWPRLPTSTGWSPSTSPPRCWKAVALDRIAGILRPGGVLRLHDLIYDFQPAEAETVLERWMDGAATDPSFGYTRDDFATHIRTEFSTYRWLLEPMLDAAGFEIVQTDFNRSVYGACTCIKR